MTDSALDSYRRLMNELLILREAEGGDLPVEVESAYVERLDDLWWELAKAAPPAGPEELALVDCEVDKGSHSTPRKAA